MLRGGTSLAALVGLAFGQGPTAGNLPIPGGKYSLKWVENISVPVHPGYVNLAPELGGVMIVTSFEAMPFFGKNAVYLADPSHNASSLQMLPGSDKLNWPNAITAVGNATFGFPAVVIGSGFLVPTHSTGGIWVLEASAEPRQLQAPVQVTKPISGWFYHLAVPVDMNGDGRPDLVTARCEYGLMPWSAKRGELLWLEQPQAEPFSGGAWQEHHLADGPDFLFCLQPGETLALVAAEYVSQRMVYFFMRGGELKSRILDASSGAGFSCSFVDLNGDGRMELLATNHLNQNGSVYAYSFAGDDFATAPVTRHVLATGFSATTTKSGSASPGAALAFHPRITDKGRPHIFLSGDNSNSVFVLVPLSQEAGNWSYATKQIAYLGADVGMPAIGDTNGDGFADVFVPAYDNNVLVHYEFAPATTAAPASPISVQIQV